MASILYTWARALGGEVSGRQVLCPGPGHSARDRSLAVLPSVNAPGGWTVHSHAGDDWRTCRDYVASRIGQPLFERRRTSDRLPVRVDSTSAPDNSGVAATVWRDARPIEGTLAERYLIRRCGRLPAHDLFHVLRFHQRARWAGESYPALIARMTDPVTNEPRGVHRTFLNLDGSKAEPGKRMLGPAGVIRLWPDEDVTYGLHLAEGIETALAAAHLLGAAPVWACGSARALASFPVLAGIDALTVVADHDESGAGERAAAAVCQRWADAGREAAYVIPRELGDAADLIGRAA